MPIITLLVALALVGVVAYLLVTYVPMTPGIKNLISIAAVIICVLILLEAFGLLHGLGNVPQLR